MKNLWRAAAGLALLCAAGAASAQTAAPAPAAPPPAAAPVATAPAAPAPPPAAAPAPPAAGADWMTYSPYAGETNDIRNPNRTQEEIISWSQQRATEVLSFSPADIEGKLNTMKKVFTQQGWTDYANYVKDSKLADMVRSQGYSVTTIVNGDTLILNSGSMAGSYHWLVELPLMVTFLHSSGVDGEPPKAVAGGEFKLILQLGRVAAKQGIDGMAIESWKMQAKAAAVAP